MVLPQDGRASRRGVFEAAAWVRFFAAACQSVCLIPATRRIPENLQMVIRYKSNQKIISNIYN
jgi:hypothetical protein